MPRVLRILNRFNLGGPTYNAAYLTKYMAPDFQTLLIGGENDESEKNSEFILKNLDLHPIVIKEMKRSINFSNDVIAYQRIKSIIKRFKPDVVHTHASKAGVLGRLAASNQNVKVILHTFHGHVFDSYFNNITTSFYKSVERRMAERSTKIIAISELQKKELVSKYHICSADKIEVIPLGLDLSRFRENMNEKRKTFRKKYNIDDDEITVGMVGRIVPVKNHRFFIDAIKAVMGQTDKKIRWFIVGDGEEKDNVKTYAKSIGIQYFEGSSSKNKYVLTFTSWIKEADLVMAGMDIVALTSLNEGTPVSLIEAQAAGKPIISTMVGGIENVVLPNKTALLSKTNDLPSFIKNTLLLIENDNLRSQISVEGWNYVENKFHYTRLVNDMKKLYNRLLD
jgi:glycosyltransferase involved in cell wall biosynthesis